MTDQDDSRCLKCGHFNQLHDGKCRVPNCTCGHSDHAARVRELEEAVRVLANLYVYGSKVDNARNAMEESGEHQHDVRKKAWIVALDEYDEAIALAMDNPIAADAVKEAGNAT